MRAEAGDVAADSVTLKLRRPVTYTDPAGKLVTIAEVTLTDPCGGIYDVLDALGGDAAASQGRMIRALALACSGLNAGIFAKIGASDHLAITQALGQVVDLAFLSDLGASG